MPVAGGVGTVEVVVVVGVEVPQAASAIDTITPMAHRRNSRTPKMVRSSNSLRRGQIVPTFDEK